MREWMISTLILLGFLVPVMVKAQTVNNVVNEVTLPVSGKPNAPAKPQAPAAPEVANPAPKIAQVPFLTGGIGKAERDEMQARKGEFNLQVKVAQKSGHYLSDHMVKITDKEGMVLLEQQADGPLFFVKLEPGEYTASARYQDESHAQNFSIKDGVPMREVEIRFDVKD